MSTQELLLEEIKHQPESVLLQLQCYLELLKRQAKPKPPMAKEWQDLENEFKALAEQWYRDTRMMSFIRQKAVHPAYQKIIGMGWHALPLILRELRARGGDWLWALEAVSRKNPASGITNFKQAVSAWLAWGKENSYID